ncbi:MAG TPA: metalloregulator ArsR/SmtB family transcription factor [Vicinamibacterales bacterium]|nr:metalloregulator ArsR/SmtB family transcription factor [Vicinamibacterales bacterium]
MAVRTGALPELEGLFKALADTTRLRILNLLLAGEVCVCDIHDTLGIPQPKASRHLAYLRASGLVDARKDGQWVHYKLSTSRDPIVSVIRDAVAHALGHVDAVKKDAARLEKRTGCCVPETKSRRGCACCAPSAPA